MSNIKQIKQDLKNSVKWLTHPSSRAQLSKQDCETLLKELNKTCDWRLIEGVTIHPIKNDTYNKQCDDNLMTSPLGVPNYCHNCGGKVKEVKLIKITTIVEPEDNEPYCDECGETENFAHTQSTPSLEWYRCRNCGNDQVTTLPEEL